MRLRGKRPGADVREEVPAEPSMDRLERVFLAHLGQLYAFLRARCRDSQLAEDLCQQVFLKAVQARVGFRGDDGAMVGWLFQIARNESVSLSRRRVRETSLDAMVDWASEPIDPDDRPDEIVAAIERRSEIGDLLARLSDEQREVVELRFVAELSLVQIAQVLAIPDATVRQRLFRALRRLKGMIDDPSTLR